ncbi:hypothetical protein D3C80_1633930 [compost metagenome]
MEELPVALTDYRSLRINLAARHNLPTDIINAGHMLPGQPAEKMPQAGTRPGMHVIVFNQVADVLHIARFTPVSDLSGEISLHQPGY